MHKLLKIFIIYLFTFHVLGQERNLPGDLRQHNLNQFNSSLFNPTFSFDRNMPRSITLWSRWQWQTIDADPTTIFLNYTQKLDAQSSAGIGFFQHNTGVLINTGAILNYGYAIPLGEESNLIFGTNISFYNQKLADDRLIDDSQIDLVELSTENSFIAEFAPGLRIQANGFSMAITIENALDYNFSDNEREAASRIFSASISNDFPVFLFDGVSYLRPMAYVRAIPNEDTQYGLTALFSNPKFWVQGGYNSFYGVSGGAGATLFEKFSIGALMEFGLDNAISDEDPTFEIVASYYFGKQSFAAKEKKEKKSAEERMDDVEERRWLAEEERERQRLEREQQLATERQDSINKVREAELAAVREQNRLDSIARVLREQEVEVQPNEKYEEVVTSDGLEPGFYLIANVFGTQKYYESFMNTLRTKGIEPKSFFRSLNGYNYVYLGRYNTIGEARAARDSNFNGKYSDALWIFRVRGK
ncbi:PorP/SprF family type IX secretion system membrane protein [Croceitalea rosinachiae]|uniref:PorP/SprF family type IX secretion system membrane protein n=1 Tax=Croceitalea rosinachiae TaxID=3075596 RepID=A0ABU3ABU4_9FLAO|nr:PorP/SprF family type IX secretion system membrane protein [Croceitalea sp. F388]MDT0607295.1 PorP/SprF family type IX secretion system membrane protein [Croceitalea sp. F388]